MSIGRASTGSPAPTAVIAEDEPLLAAALERMLREAWPQLRVERVVHDGDAALRAIDALHPQVAFLDIRMPGRTGLELAAELANRGQYVPEIVFVTAYDQYAIEAFDAAAVDYLLKPVAAERLARCVARLQARLVRRPAALVEDPQAELKRLLVRLEQRLAEPGQQSGADSGFGGGAGTYAGAITGTVAGHHAVSGTGPPGPTLRFLLASVGSVTRHIPVAEVLYFEARDKYVAVVTAE
jgi:DNA-binding LytR/AlgR family response regulator